MTYYSVRILSFQFQLDPERVIRNILSCSTINKLIFPLVIPRREDKVTITSPQEFKLSLIPPEFCHDDYVRLDVYKKNGIPLSGMISSQESITADVITTRFKTEDLLDRNVSYSILKSLLEEIIPVFHVSHASVYDTEIVHREGRPRGFAKKLFPYGIDWMTYFGPELVDYIGRDRFDRLHTCHEKYELNGGIMVILQEEPFREDNPQHRARQEQAEAEMNLLELAAPP